MFKKEEKKLKDEIEIIDLDDNNEEQIEEQTQKKKVVKRKLKKGLLAQTIFCILSLFFIIGCFIYYGIRFYKYYHIFNPKDENGKAVSLISNHITSNATFVYEGDGLYLTNGNYIYKGINVDNYIKYSGFMWRIIKINEDKTIDIVLDESINNLKWNSTISNFNDTDISKYLNEVFLSNLNKDLLTNTIVCNDDINDINEISCNKTDSKKLVRLLNINEFLNSKSNEKSYISDGTNIWLSSKGSKKILTINSDNLSYADPTFAYYIKPVVTLKNTNQLLDGKGTKESPYIIEKETKDIFYGDHIKLGQDIWTVYDMDKDTLKLTLTNLYKEGLKTYRFDLNTNKYNPENKSSLAMYLNKDFYESLSYKDKLLETEWYIGEYNDSYMNIYTDIVKSKVGIPSIVDFKFDKEASNYYILNGAPEGKNYLYADGLIETKGTLSRGIKPCINIKKTKIKTGDGSVKTPYELED